MNDSSPTSQLGFADQWHLRVSRTLEKHYIPSECSSTDGPQQASQAW